MNNNKLFGALVFVVAAMVGCANVDEGSGPAMVKIPNGTVVAVSRELYIAVSRDSGATWTTIQHEAGLPEREGLLVRASYIKETGRFFAFGWRMFSSTDAVTFAKLERPIDEWFGEVAYGNGIYLSGGGYGQVITSTDGITWKAATQVPDVDINGIRSAAFGNGKFALADMNQNVFVTADNGATWTKDPLRTVNVGFCDGAFKDGETCMKSNATKSIWIGHGYMFRAERSSVNLERSGDGKVFQDLGLILPPRDLAFAPPL